MKGRTFGLGILLMAGIVPISSWGLGTFEINLSAGEVKPGTKGSFPRTDGVYRYKRKTSLVGLENQDVYDYIVFKKGAAYTITGGYLPPNNYYVEMPSKDFPGAFQMLSIVDPIV
jgi:hypothetical protein